jgi:phosphoglycolate phosphatase
MTSAVAGPTVVALFDIDGTLIRAGDPAHRAAFDHALQHVHGVPATLDGIPLAGMLDRQIARAALAVHAIDHAASDARLTELVEAMGEHYAASVAIGDRVAHVLPGAREAAVALREAGVALAVVTGTARPVALAKLAAAHLDDLFPVGAYGDEHHDRAALVRRGIELAGDFYGTRFAPSDAFVVGDTPRDVAAARGAGTRVVAVASGAVDRPILEESAPDLLLDDLTDTHAIVEFARAAV